eukprot:jgi/Bigna1/137587/aug1.40_g12295
MSDVADFAHKINIIDVSVLKVFQMCSSNREPELHRKAFRSRGDKMISQHDPILFATESKNSMAEIKNPLSVLDPVKISPPISFKEPSSGLFNDDKFPSRDEMNDEEIMKHHLDYFDSASSR